MRPLCQRLQRQVCINMLLRCGFDGDGRTVVRPLCQRLPCLVFTMGGTFRCTTTDARPCVPTNRYTSNRYTSDRHTSNRYTSDRHTSNRYTSDRHTSNRYTSDRHTSHRHTSDRYTSKSLHVGLLHVRSSLDVVWYLGYYYFCVVS